MPTTQFSAHISTTAKHRLDELARVTGRSRREIIEDAILHEAAALDAIPEDFILSARVVLRPESARLVLELMDKPRKAPSPLRRALRRI